MLIMTLLQFILLIILGLSWVFMFNILNENFIQTSDFILYGGESEALLGAIFSSFGYIIGFDCSCPPNADHVGKIIFCLGVFIPMIFIIVNEVISLLFPDIDVLNPFLPPGSSDVEGKKF